MYQDEHFCLPFPFLNRKLAVSASFCFKSAVISFCRSFMLLSCGFLASELFFSVLFVRNALILSYLISF
jgi:hypothetical protein